MKSYRLLLGVMLFTLLLGACAAPAAPAGEMPAAAEHAGQRRGPLHQLSGISDVDGESCCG